MKRPKSNLLIDILADAPAVPSDRQGQINQLVSQWYEQLFGLARLEIGKIEAASGLIMFDQRNEFERLFNGLLEKKLTVA